MLESDPTLGIVIPVYNEANNILPALAAIEEHAPVPITVRIVADTQEDTTFQVLDQFRGEMVEVVPMINEYGPGALNAIKWGLDHSVESAVLVTMADLSDDMASLYPMWASFLQGSDLVCASRYMKGGRQVGGPRFKVFLSRTAGLSLYYLAGLPTHDVTNSFKLYSREVLQSVQIESTGGFEIGMEIVVKAWAQGFRISEVPSVWYDRTDGTSRFRLWAWLPNYLRWYFFCLSRGVFKRLGLQG